MFRLFKMDKPQVMVFRPTMEEFKNFPRFIAHMEELDAHKVGLAKVRSKCNSNSLRHFI